MPSLIHPTTIRISVILAHYFMNVTFLYSVFKIRHSGGDEDDHLILLYLELYDLEILQPKLHYLYFQFLTIYEKYD
jgi:hypothetical protein